MLDNIRSKLAIGKGFPISEGGRTTLIKGVLSSIPAYFTAIFRISIGVSKIIEKAFRNFLWKGRDSDKGSHLVSWDLVTTPRDLGGLGIDNIRSKNSTLLVKWLWQFEKEPEAMWRLVIKSKYGENFIRDHLACKKWKCCSSPWKDIAMLAGFYKVNRKFKIGRGDKVLF